MNNITNLKVFVFPVATNEQKRDSPYIFSQ